MNQIEFMLSWSQQTVLENFFVLAIISPDDPLQLQSFNLKNLIVLYPQLRVDHTWILYVGVHKFCLYTPVCEKCSYIQMVAWKLH